MEEGSPLAWRGCGSTPIWTIPNWTTPNWTTPNWTTPIWTGGSIGLPPFGLPPFGLPPIGLPPIGLTPIGHLVPPKSIFQKPYRIILGPPEHVVHLVWSSSDIYTSIKTALNVVLYG